MHTDAIIVGSGFGGAVSAARLAERGMRVLVLERGPWWGPDRPHQTGPRRPFPRGAGLRRALRGVRVNRGGRARKVEVAADGLYELHLFEALTVLTGSGVGGGSLIYTNIQEEPEADYFDAFPDEVTAEGMAPLYARVRQMIGPEPLPEAIRPGTTGPFVAAAEGEGEVKHPDLAVYFGQDGPRRRNAQGVEQQECNHCGGCVVGCGRGAKSTLDLNYIPLAQRKGAQVRPMAEVVAIGEVEGGYQVRWVDRRTGQQLQLSAPRVVLAAGTLGTLRLLMQAREVHRTLPGLPASLGRRFSANGDAASLLWGVRRHASGGAPSFNAWVSRRGEGGAHRLLTGRVNLPDRALGLPAAVRRRLDDLALLISMGRDGAGGHMELRGGELATRFNRNDAAALHDAIDAMAEALAEGFGASGALASLAPGARGLASVHPLGGASVGEEPESGVVDHRGQVFGHPGLYVADGAALPAAPGVPPSMTIAAFSERVSALME